VCACVCACLCVRVYVCVCECVCVRARARVCAQPAGLGLVRQQHHRLHAEGCRCRCRTAHRAAQVFAPSRPMTQSPPRPIGWRMPARGRVARVSARALIHFSPRARVSASVRVACALRVHARVVMAVRGPPCPPRRGVLGTRLARTGAGMARPSRAGSCTCRVPGTLGVGPSAPAPEVPL
jgi:hypothetical protein